MQIEATYNKGRLELPKNIRLSREVFKIRIEIPAEVIAKREKTERLVDTASGAFNIRGQLDEILGCRRDGKPGKFLTAGDYKEIWHEHLEEKYLDGK
ncbi:MAG: hypothetical protein JRI32_10760 [Deltaproteobacteria bacterium]|nr:hypothetical protein [Deltaproteobacteria bacterium]